MAYASNIKRILKDFYQWDGVSKDPYWRNKLQQLGTEKIRNGMKRPLFHVGRVCEDIEIIQDDFDYIIIDDCRFPNELLYPQAIFGDKVISIRITRENYISSLTPEQLSHESEIALDNYKHFDYFLNILNGEEYVKVTSEQFAVEVLDE